MLSLSAFRSLSLSSGVPTLAIRGMAVKAAASSASSKSKAQGTGKTTKSATTTKTKEATKPAKAKATKPTKEKKAEPKPKVNLKKIEPVDIPKRPGTAWSMFYTDHLNDIKAAGKPVLPLTETGNAAAIWKQLSPSEKKVYEDRHQARLAEYRKQMDQRLQEMTPIEFKLENSRRQALRAAGKSHLPSLKDPNAPKRPLSSYFLFSQEQRQSGKFDTLSVQEQAKAFAAEWKNLPASEKAQYTAIWRASSEAYKAAKADYEAKRAAQP
ncbi:exp1-like protein [Mortierella sp. AM989]|nr:exp1-like protein [Mortierella sp. AM989]